jgi:CBS domain containing-hemolysin-like protein
VTVLALTLAAVLALLAATLRFGGASLVRTSRAQALRDAADGDRGAARVAGLLEDRLGLQPALNIVLTALLVAGTIPASWALSALLSGWGLVAAFIGLGCTLVVVGDVLPRSLGRGRPRRPAYLLSWLLGVSIRVGERATDLMLDDGDDDDDQGDAQDAGEIELITSVLEFTDAVVREVMVPRADMVTIRSTESTDRALDLVIAEGRSRVPVIGESLDDVVGVLYARDLLGLMDSGEGPQPVTRIMRPALFVPETQRLSGLLKELQGEKVHLAIVVDEFGSTAGLVSIEDLLEEIVGEIVDEYDVEEPMATPLAGGGYLVDGRLPVEDLARLVGVGLPDEDWDTVGGLVLGLAGRVPSEGETFEVEGLVLVPERVQGRRVSRVRVVPR